MASASPNNWLGVVASALGDERKQQLRVKSGVLVEAVSDDSPAGRAGIRAGDVILQINNQDVTAPAQFNEAVNKLDKAKNLVVLVRRGDAAQYVPIKP